MNGKNTVPSRPYWEVKREELARDWEKIKNNFFVNMVFPLQDLSEGHTEALIPYVIPGGGVARQAVRVLPEFFRKWKVAKEIDKMVPDVTKVATKVPASKVIQAEPVLERTTEKVPYVLRQRPLTEAELMGMPRGERNQITLKLATDFDRDLIRVKNKNGELVPLKTNIEHPIFNEHVGEGQIYYVDGVPYKNAVKGQYTIEDPFNGRPLVQKLDHSYYTPGEEKYILYADKPKGLKDFSSVLTDYAKTLPEEIITKDSQFADNDFINYFINYYKNLGYDISNVNPKHLVKIINENYKQLAAGQTGKLQGRIFWNGSPNRYVYNPETQQFTLVKQGFPEQFTKLNLPQYASTSPTENVGTYFGTQPFSQYAFPSVRYVHSGNGIDIKQLPDFITGYDMQPYLINGVSTIYDSRLPSGLKGVIPRNTALYSNHFKGNNSRNYHFGYSDELAVGLDSNIKGLFPHPEAFKINSDGTIQLIRDWNNPNLHYKNGGSLNYLQLLKKGCSIHIKPENKGKFTETKKRTGKTTEELTHSKNPITRKRAIFAQNAAKWHH